MSVEEQVSADDAVFAITRLLERATDAELNEDSVLMQDIRSKLPLVGSGELLRQLREAEGVIGGLVCMGDHLSPATYCMLTCAHTRAERALEVAEDLY